MARVRVVSAFFWMFAFAGVALAQEPSQDPAPAATPSAVPAPAQALVAAAPSDAPPAATVSLTVPKGTPLQIALDREVRVLKAGQPIHGRIVQPVYAFDRLVVPVGCEVTGQISKISPIPGKQRTLSILNANFSPDHQLELNFNDLILADGKHIPLRTTVTPGSGQVIQLVSADETGKKKTAKQVVSEKIKEAKQEARREWDNAMKQVKTPGKRHRIGRYAVAQLPVHPQYIDAGALYFAELAEPLDFGVAPFSKEWATTMGAPPPPGSLVHALLVTPLDSATTQKGAEVEAVLSQPLLDAGRLILPQGSRLKGSVVQVQPARHMARNGQLRIVFHDLVLPDGVPQRVDASLEGVESAKADHVELDSEGGAEATSSKTRYLAAAISLGLGVASFGGDADDLINHGAGGANGFRLVGMALGASVQSRSLGYSMGAYGAVMSVYTHFISRGRDVVFPKNTAMEIGFGARSTPPPKAEESSSTKQ